MMKGRRVVTRAIARDGVLICSLDYHARARVGKHRVPEILGGREGSGADPRAAGAAPP